MSAGASSPAGHVFYLHGFASSPSSSKAAYFAERLRPFGLTLERPDFNAPDFETLTISRMLAQLDRELARLAPGPVTLVGSSLGGALAVLAAARLPRVGRLMLLAPSVMFAKPGHRALTPEMVAAWRRDKTMTFFHHGYGEARPLALAFYEDSLAYSPMDAAFDQPTVIVQGLRDEAVDYRTVERFARARPNVTLHLVDDDHSLQASLPRLWTELRAVLELPS